MAPTKTPKIGTDGKTKQQRYLDKPGNREMVNAMNAKRNREKRQREREGAGAPMPEHSLSSVYYNPRLIVKSEVLESRFATWIPDTQRIISYIDKNSSYKTGWTSSEPFIGSSWEEATEKQHKDGDALLSDLSKLLRQLSSQRPYFKASSDAWELTFGEITYMIEYLTILERIKLSFTDLN